IKRYPIDGDEVIGKFDKLGHYDEASNLVKEESVSVYFSRENGAYLVVDESTSAIKKASENFLDNLKNILNKTTDKDIVDQIYTYFEKTYAGKQVVKRGGNGV